MNGQQLYFNKVKDDAKRTALRTSNSTKRVRLRIGQQAVKKLTKKKKEEKINIFLKN